MKKELNAMSSGVQGIAQHASAFAHLATAKRTLLVLAIAAGAHLFVRGVRHLILLNPFGAQVFIPNRTLSNVTGTGH